MKKSVKTVGTGIVCAAAVCVALALPNDIGRPIVSKQYVAVEDAAGQKKMDDIVILY